MQRKPAQSPRAQAAIELIQKLQRMFVGELEALSSESFTAIEWFRDQGQHGGGVRYVSGDNTSFNRASVNMSQVQYDDDPHKKLASASALSTIIHPQNPYAPSMHMHISWTELKSGTGYWRMMADLNPAIPDQHLKERFEQCLQTAAPAYYSEAKAQGERYFYIPALKRHRGVAHFYLEAFSTDDPIADSALAERLGTEVIKTYSQLIKTACKDYAEVNSAAQQTQLDYHSVYFFQVLTLDRGTTSGLLVHNQNDVGILGSLPSHVNKPLLLSWRALLPEPQAQLLQTLLDVLPDLHPCPIDETSKQALAEAIRTHYQKYPQALDLQASGSITPPTIANHQTNAD